jgi:N-dimethylarginine dimethylaminohydrolase
MSGGERRILMCPPDHYRIVYEINPWMDRRRPSHGESSRRQWEALVALLERLGAAIERIDPVPELPDMVFTANAGLICRDLFIPSRFRHEQRRGESRLFCDWFAQRGYRIRELEPTGDFEGAGDALFCGETLFAGYLHRSDIRTHQQLAKFVDFPVVSLELVDPRFYHLDTCFCPLERGAALFYPSAFDEYGRRVLERHIERLIAVCDADAERFACNAVVLGRDVVLNSGSASTARELARLGFTAHPTDLAEYLKAGGAAKCLTLRLDGEEAAPWRNP